jgi:uncharacterized protein
MRSLQCAGLLAVGFITAFAMPVGGFAAGTKINFSSLDNDHPAEVSGRLYLPENRSGPCPAVVMVHGTSGIDVRGTFHRKAMVSQGIAVFEVDFKTGIFTSPSNRPPNETFVPMAFAALKELRKLPAIDPTRIAIMGFSLGGGVTLRTALEIDRKMWMGTEPGFAAHVAFYPVSRPFMKRLVSSGSTLTGAPMIIFYGTEDAYGEGTAVPALKKLLSERYNFQVTTVEYAGASHGFDRDGPPMHYYDPAAINQRGYMAWDEDAANDSLRRVAAFLGENLGVK